MIKPEDVTIIIPTLGGSKETEFALNECCVSLRETVPNIKKIIVHNGGLKGGDRTTNRNEEIIVLTEQGQCKAVNAAVATINTEWIFVTNDDMIYAPGWFDKLVEPLGQKYLANTSNVNLEDLENKPHRIIPVNDVNSVIALKEIMCISPQLVEPRGGAPTFIEHFLGGAGGDFDKQGWIDYAANHVGGNLRSGFNLPFLIKRELWDTIGGYDINYDPWGSNSDSDLEYKIKLAGVQPYQNTNCIVYHFSQTSGTFNPANDAARFRNYAYFKEKWGFDRTDNGIWEATFEIPTKEQGRIYNPDWERKYI